MNELGPRKREAGHFRLWAGLAVIALALLAALIFFRRQPPPAPPPGKPAIIPNDMLNAANPKQGAKIFKSCSACHSVLAEGEPNKVGPPLFGIVGAGIARRTDFEYSEALQSLRGRSWNTDELYEWLRDPAGYAPGTKMAYNGLLDPQDRADLIAYLILLK